MALLKKWHDMAYSETTDKGTLQKLWTEYFQKERDIYAQLLKNPDEVVKGTVKELAEKYKVDIMTMVGFLDGINDSLKEQNPIEEMEEDTEVNLGFEKELLYKNMVNAGADWLYNLPEWEAIFDEDKRKALYKEEKASHTIRKEEKIYPNDPCPCGSGKKYKKCCGKNAANGDSSDTAANERLSVYLPMRDMQMRFVSKCVMPLCDADAYAAAATRLGITRNTVGAEDNVAKLLSVIGDFAAMMDDQSGLPPIKRLLENPGQFTGDKLRVLEMYRQYRYTWLKVLDAEPGVGVKCRDLLTDEEVFLMETSLSRSHGIREMTLCVGVGVLPNGTLMALGAISPAGFDNPEVILKIVLSHLGIASDLPIRLSFADQARFAAETIKRLHSIGRYNSIVYGGLKDE